jgi:hypothetical protein
MRAPICAGVSLGAAGVVLAAALGAACGSGGPPATFVVPDSGGDGAAAVDAGPPPVFKDGAADGPSTDGKPMAFNLIPNGDFEQGNVLFGSDYAFAVNNTVEGQYTVGTSGQAFNGALVTAGDHTSGTTKMFIGNGKSTPDRVWFTQTSIPVQPNTQYYFEAFVMNLCCATGLGNGIDPVGPSVLSFYANGQLLGTRTSMKLGKWEGLTTVWSSGSATSVDLKLVNANTEALGNDFAVDDIYLGTISTVNPPN